MTKTKSFRKRKDKRAIAFQIPKRLDKAIRLQATMSSMNLSEWGTYTLAKVVGHDPAQYGIDVVQEGGV